MEKAIKTSSLNDKDGAFKTYLTAVDGKSNAVARSVASDILGEEVFWDWDGKLEDFANLMSSNTSSSSSYKGRLLPLHWRRRGA